jgi:FkbM family methyltransferase
MNTTLLTMVDGVRVVVPDSLDLITPYVLREQQDWFEDEIRFLRKILRAGQQVIDIGANYGVYTLSMAHAVGPKGKVWAFEPASSTADLLAQSIAANGFSHVILEKSALSSEIGSARLSLNDHSELNELIRDGSGGTSGNEVVPLTTLDDCLKQYEWKDIAVVKIDAEGEEANILKGGRAFFSALSPLIEYEVKAADTLHLELIDAFAALGYRSYRLIPGLNLLVPFHPDAAPDAYLLNLFCCKADRAALLAADGYLVDSPLGILSPASLPEKYHWRQSLAALPYGKQLLPRWEATVELGDSSDVESALLLFAYSQDVAQGMVKRLAALRHSFDILFRLCEKNPAHLRQASLARVAAACGARGVAVNALGKLSDAMIAQKHVDPSEPFLAPSARFDSLPPVNPIGNWVLASVMEELERLSALSSFFLGDANKGRLEFMIQLGFASEEMQRRLALVKQRFRLASASGE